MSLPPTAANFRAELARHALTRQDLAVRIGMNPNQLSQFLAGSRPLPGWAAHNIGLGINAATGERLIDVDESLGLLPAPPPGRPPRWNRPEEVDPIRRPAEDWRRARRTG